MKQILKSFLCVAAFAALLAGFNSCEPSSRQHRGEGGFGPEQPVRPGDGGEQPEQPGSLDITLTDGWADYYGQWYNQNTDNYVLHLYEGKTDSEGNFTGSAHMLTLDLIVSKSSTLGIRNGVYSCSDEEGRTFIFVPAYDNKDEDGNPVMDGSTLYIQRDKNHHETIAVTDGVMEIKSYVTGQIGVEATIVAGGQEYKFHFKGKVEVFDESQGGGGGGSSDIPKNVEMKNITRVVAEDWGQVWDGIECTDYRDWVLYFYDKDFSSTNEYTCVEILTEEKYTKSLPEQTFNKVATLDNTAAFVPGAIIAGYTDEDNYAWGTWYCKGGTAWYAATKGSLDVKKSGDGYALTFDFVDEDETYGGTFKGSYTGKVEFTSAESQSGAAKRTAGKFMQPRRGSAVARTARPATRGSHSVVKVK